VVPFDARTAGVTNEIAEQIGGADCNVRDDDILLHLIQTGRALFYRRK
jgi:hypothetical protein